MRKRISFSLANCKCRTANEHWSSERLEAMSSQASYHRVRYPDSHWMAQSACVHSPAAVRKQHRLLSLWGKLPWISLYLPEGQHDAFAQACNIEELIRDNWGMCSHTSVECRSLMPLLRYCLTLGDTRSTCFCSMGRHAGPEALWCWTANLWLQGL